MEEERELDPGADGFPLQGQCQCQYRQQRKTVVNANAHYSTTVTPEREDEMLHSAMMLALQSPEHRIKAQ